MLQKARSTYETAAQKAGETAAYPGNWLYESWSGRFPQSLAFAELILTYRSESDLKEWLDKHGIPAPQPTSVSLLSCHRCRF